MISKNDFSAHFVTSTYNIVFEILFSKEICVDRASLND